MRAYFEKRFPKAEVTWRGNGFNADQDFLYLITARRLIAAGGRFSDLAALVARRRGAEVYDPDEPGSNGEFCKKHYRYGETEVPAASSSAAVG